LVALELVATRSHPHPHRFPSEWRAR